MKAKLIINGLDISRVIRENGLKQSEIQRLGRSVITLDGTLYQTQTVKRRLDVGLVNLRDDGWYAVEQALATRPASVTYLDDSLGERTALFYVVSPTAAAKTVRGSHTWFGGISFALEER